MSDSYTSVSNRSLGDNLLASIKGLLLGILMFFASFPILWVNEGCVDLSTVAKTAVVVKPDGAGTSGEGKLISVTADLKVDETVADPELLVPDRYVKLQRKVEMYAWSEKKETSTQKKLGGGSTTTTTYTYDLGWTDSPKSSSAFSHPEGHENPGAGIEARSFFPAHAKVGAFSFAPQDLELPSPSPLTLSTAMVKAQETQHAAVAPAPPAPTPTKGPAGKRGKTPAPVKAPPAADTPAPSSSAFRFTGTYLFRGKGSAERPVIGDVRVSYDAVLPGKQVTLYGQRQGSNVVAYMHEGKDKLFRVVPGTHEQAMAQLHGEHVMMTWIVRACGFLAMWLGLSLVLGPFNAVLDIVPFVGSAGRFVTGLAMFPVAFVLSGVTIFVAIIAHSTILLVLTIVLVVGGLTALILVRRKNAPARPPGGGGPTQGGYGGPPQGGYGGPPQGGYGGPPQGGGPPMGGYGPPPGGG